MRKISILALAAVALFAACTPKYNPNDARTFGLTGDVKEVRFSEEMLESSSEEAAEHFWADKDKLEMTFDEKGRITLDAYGTVYQYDENGVFVAEEGSAAVMSRDTRGRIEAYDNTCLDDVDFSHYDISKYYKASYEYDAKGRPARGEFAGWEWGETRTYQYDGVKVYPSVVIKEGGSEGWNEKTTVTYEYTKFDARGNWTERFVTRQTDGWEACEEGVEPEVETTVVKIREIRAITYWSDAE
ncbi:MAG: hypothetical protein IKQ76_04165 [Bacteroidales bacterium]|nr:hypothetical protein [Bacteroidales bacterium]